LPDRAYSEIDKVDYEFEQLLEGIALQITKYRRNYLSGASPFSIRSSAGVTSDIFNRYIGVDRNDLVLILSETEFPSNLCDLVPGNDTGSFAELTDFYNNKQIVYLTIFNKSVEEGLPELGVALLSLYIFYRTLMLKGRFGNLHELMPAIEQALSLPGSKVLKNALSFVVESVDLYFSNDPVALCSANYFRQHIPQSAQLHVIEGGGKGSFGRQQSEENVREFLFNVLGKVRWEKLSEKSRNCLVSAELQWRNSAVEFGFGIKDWSGLIITYCKAIEAELVERLKYFF